MEHWLAHLYILVIVVSVTISVVIIIMVMIMIGIITYIPVSMMTVIFIMNITSGSLLRRSGQLSRESSKAASQSTAEADDAQRRFGNAKSISSSMYDEDANKANDFEKQAMLSKFSVGVWPMTVGLTCVYCCCSCIACTCLACFFSCRLQTKQLVNKVRLNARSSHVCHILLLSNSMH